MFIRVFCEEAGSPVGPTGATEGASVPAARVRWADEGNHPPHADGGAQPGQPRERSAKIKLKIKKNLFWKLNQYDPQN